MKGINGATENTYRKADFNPTQKIISDRTLHQWNRWPCEVVSLLPECVQAHLRYTLQVLQGCKLLTSSRFNLETTKIHFLNGSIPGLYPLDIIALPHPSFGSKNVSSFAPAASLLPANSSESTC